MNASCTILIVTCEEYFDAVVNGDFFFHYFWKDCPYEAVVTTDVVPRNAPKLHYSRVFEAGQGTVWSERVAFALKQITTPYVMILCDDYYVNAPVDNSRLALRLSQAMKYNALNLRLFPMPMGQLSFRTEAGEPPLREYKKNTPYCIATQAGLWRRECLQRLVAQTGSGWDFERRGSFLVGEEPYPILCTLEKEFPFLDAIHKGHWERRAKVLAEQCGYEGIDFSQRGFVPLKVWLIEHARALALRCLPRSFILKLRNKYS